MPTQRGIANWIVSKSRNVRGYAPSQPKRALAYYDKLVDHVIEMQRDGSSDWESDLTQTSGLAERSDIKAKLGKLAAAVRDNQRAVTSLAHLYLIEHNHMMGLYLNDIRAHLAELLTQMHRYREARQASDAAISWLRSDVAAAPLDGSRLRVLGLVLAARASIEDRSGARAAACSAGRRFTDILRSVDRLRAATPSDAGPSGPIPEAAQVVARDC